MSGNHLLFALIAHFLTIIFCCCRDVARAHINAIESSAVVGRYCLSQPAMSIERILYIVHQQFPHIQVPSEKVRLLCYQTI